MTVSGGVYAGLAAGAGISMWFSNSSAGRARPVLFLVLFAAEAGLFAFAWASRVRWRC